MKLNCKELPDSFQRGVLELERYGFLKNDSTGRIVKAVHGTSICVEKNQGEMVIFYDTKPHFYMALARSIGMTEGVHKIEPKAKDLGLMLDCSRNAVAKPDMVKRLICLLVMTGYNYLELYTEDTYELPDEPYFGYKRGRYSKEELEEIVAFADIFDFQMVPCIQALAHLSKLANWGPYFDHMDIDDILLVGDERTYALIRKCIRFSKEVFHTKRINIGTDEAFRLGRGKYTDTYGYKSKHEIYLEHLKKVFKICQEEGVEPEFWADAFYETECAKEEVQSIFDGTQMPIYWDYYTTDIEHHNKRMSTLKEYAGKVMYAGGLWKWFGFAPDNGFSDKITDAALEAAKRNSVDNILMTAWGDNGDECSIYAVIPSMWYTAQQLYTCDVDLDAVIKELTGYTYDEWKMADRLNYVMPELDKQSNADKYLFYNDFIIGLLDYHIPHHAGEIYRELNVIFDELAVRESAFSYIFDNYAKLSKVLIRKATYGKRLYEAYQNGDRDEMNRLVAELQEIKIDMQQFYGTMRTLWLKENKGFGFEVLDVRIGGLISRIDTVTIMLEDYLEGRTEKIYELEEERIPYWSDSPQGNEKYAVLHPHWGTLFTVNSI